MDRVEAKNLLRTVIEPLRDLSYRELVERYVDRKPEHFCLDGASGRQYFAEVLGFWENGKPGPLRVWASLEDGSRWSAFHPLSECFIKGEDGGFIDE